MAARKKAPRKPRSPRAGRARRKKKPDRGGRPAIVWTEQNGEDVHRLARAGNTIEDMAAILEVSKRALEGAIAEDGPLRSFYEGGRAERRDALRTAQLRHALKGNATLLIWLGKQDLGQHEVRRVELEGPGGGPVRLESDLGGVVGQKLLQYLRSRGKK